MESPAVLELNDGDSGGSRRDGSRHDDDGDDDDGSRRDDGGGDDDGSRRDDGGDDDDGSRRRKCPSSSSLQPSVNAAVTSSSDSQALDHHLCHPAGICTRGGKPTKRRIVCGACRGCNAQDCGQCRHCSDMKKFGGPNTKKQKCIQRRCENMQLKVHKSMKKNKTVKAVKKKVHKSMKKNKPVKVVNSATAPACDCFKEKEDSAPYCGSYYTHLGSASSAASLRRLFEARADLEGEAVRFEFVRATRREGRTGQGCPMAKWIVRRGSSCEKLCVIAKDRVGHSCANRFIVVGIVVWEGGVDVWEDGGGIDAELAALVYDVAATTVASDAEPQQRRCGSNDEQTCACQGLLSNSHGSSYTFGCSYSLYNHACKFARSPIDHVRKFKLLQKWKEPTLDLLVGALADRVSPILSRLAPAAHAAMTSGEADTHCLECDGCRRSPPSCRRSCRIGARPGKPFSGITMVHDFCSHAHKDSNNLDDGVTVICTLTRPENRVSLVGGASPDHEQLHVLPTLAPAAMVDDGFGSAAQRRRIRSGALQVLSKYSTTLTTREIALKRRRFYKNPPSKNKKRMLKMTRTSEAIDSSSEHDEDNKSEHGADVEHVDGQCIKGKNFTHESAVEKFLSAGSSSASPNPDDRNPISDAEGRGEDEHLNECLIDPKPISLTEKPRGGQTLLAPSTEKPSKGFETGDRSPSPESSCAPCNISSLESHEPPPAEVSCPQSGSTAVAAAAGKSALDMSRDFTPMETSSPGRAKRRRRRRLLSSVDSGCVAAAYEQNVEHEPEVGAGQKSKRRAKVPAQPNGEKSDEEAAAADSAMFQRSSDHNNSSRDSSSSEDSVFSDVEGHSVAAPRVVHPSAVSATDDDTSADLPPKIARTESDCAEAFRDDEVGGLAISLPHGSLMIECAKHELHATTAVPEPDRFRPTRIGIVFYQHKKLHRRQHGKAYVARRLSRSAERDYSAWRQGLYIPSKKKVRQMRRRGYKFPPDVVTIEADEEMPKDYQKPDLTLLV